MALILINQKKFKKKDFRKGQLVYIPSNLICKNPNSLKEALGYITDIKRNGQRFLVKTLDGQLISRHRRNIIDAQAKRLKKETRNINMLQLPHWQDTILLDKFRDYFSPEPGSKN